MRRDLTGEVDGQRHQEAPEEDAQAQVQEAARSKPAQAQALNARIRIHRAPAGNRRRLFFARVR
jgi:hypothetical protein